MDLGPWWTSSDMAILAHRSSCHAAFLGTEPRHELGKMRSPSRSSLWVTMAAQWRRWLGGEDERRQLLELNGKAFVVERRGGQ
jgi:hypothetical protein